MDLKGIKPADKLQLDTGAVVEVLAPPSSDGRSVKARFIDAPFGPETPGPERDVSIEEVYGIFAGGDMGQVR